MKKRVPPVVAAGLAAVFTLAVGAASPRAALADGAGDLGSAGKLHSMKQAYETAREKGRRLQAQSAQLAAREQALSGRLAGLEQALARDEAAEKRAMGRLAAAANLASQRRAKAERERLRTVSAKNRLRALLRVGYEFGAVPYLEILFGAHSFSDLIRRAFLVDALLSAQDRQMRRLEGELARSRFLERRATEAEALARRFYVSARRDRLRTAQDAARAQAVTEQVSALRASDAVMANAEMQQMQRLASQISALETLQREQSLRQGRAGPSASPTVLGDLKEAVRLAGVPEDWVPWLALLVGYESGGNPAAKSPASVDGQHASGLLQMLPGTFERYAPPGYGDIWNPIDNALAAIRYIQAAYGAPWNIPGIRSASTYRGY